MNELSAIIEWGISRTVSLDNSQQDSAKAPEVVMSAFSENTFSCHLTCHHQVN